MIKVAVAGCAGRMGRTVCDAVRAANDMELVCGIDPHRPEVDFPVYPTVAAALESWTADVLVDFTQPSVVADNLREALPAGVDCVVGTTGLSNETLQELAALAPDGTCLFYAPNFTTGAVLMMEFAKAAAQLCISLLASLRLALQDMGFQTVQLSSEGDSGIGLFHQPVSPQMGHVLGLLPVSLSRHRVHIGVGAVFSDLRPAHGPARARLGCFQLDSPLFQVLPGCGRDYGVL